jgi:hypothetical protein
MALMAASLVTRWLGFGEAAVLMAGLASAAFHVGAGALTLRSCGDRSDAAGLFAAPGVIGLAIGGALAVSGHYLYLPFLILLLALLPWVLRPASARSLAVLLPNAWVIVVGPCYRPRYYPGRCRWVLVHHCAAVDTLVTEGF